MHCLGLSKKIERDCYEKTTYDVYVFTAAQLGKLIKYVKDDHQKLLLNANVSLQLLKPNFFKKQSSSSSFLLT